jgi:peptidoglycan/LPS O-acetylase OafA/YrhL
MFVTRVLLVIGVSSYSTYLWHWHLARLPVLRLVAKHPLTGRPEWNWLAYSTLYVVVATVVGYITGRLIEFPALRLRDRLFPRIAKRRARPTVEPVVTGS